MRLFLFLWCAVPHCGIILAASEEKKRSSLMVDDYEVSKQPELTGGRQANLCTTWFRDLSSAALYHVM